MDLYYVGDGFEDFNLLLSIRAVFSKKAREKLKNYADLVTVQHLIDVAKRRRWVDIFD